MLEANRSGLEPHLTVHASTSRKETLEPNKKCKPRSTHEGATHTKTPSQQKADELQPKGTTSCHLKIQDVAWLHVGMQKAEMAGGTHRPLLITSENERVLQGCLNAAPGFGTLRFEPFWHGQSHR